jgi:HSP20 family protein
VAREAPARHLNPVDKELTMFESMLSFPGGLFGELDRLQRDFDDWFGRGMPSSIRSVAPGTFPAINIGNTPNSVEIYAFAPGIDPKGVELTIDRGVLTLAGERKPPQPADARRASVYSNERPAGAFRRAVSLPDDVDPARVNATYRDGVLHVSIARRESAQPRRISIQ